MFNLSYESIKGGPIRGMGTQLNIFKEYGIEAIVSDFAIVLGCDFCTVNNKNITDRYWTSTAGYETENNDFRILSPSSPGNSPYYRNVGCRPALYFPNKINEIEYEYGEYPQWAASATIHLELEELYNRGDLLKTGKTYTTDSRKYNEYNKSFKELKHIEYYYKGKKYVRVKMNSCKEDYKKIKLSNGIEYSNCDNIWIEVKPIIWLIDTINNLGVSKYVLFSGLQFVNKIEYICDVNEFKRNISNTNLMRFLNDIFSKEIVQSQKYIISNSQLSREEEIEKLKEEVEFLRNKLQEKDKLLNNIYSLLNDEISVFKDLPSGKTKIKM